MQHICMYNPVQSMYKSKYNPGHGYGPRRVCDLLLTPK